MYQHAETSTIRARKFKHSFDGVPRHWLAGNKTFTALANGVNLLFPKGERFFIRSVRHYMDRYENDPKRMEAIRGFFGQEGQHANEHQRFFDAMVAQGFEIETFLKWYERIAYGLIEPATSHELHLATTAALEHFTAILAEHALTQHELDHAHPEMQRFLRWHASEEIEHKAVAYDVLQDVNPSYALRIRGLAMGTALLGGWWLIAAYMLLRQDGVSIVEARRQFVELREQQLRETGKAHSVVRDVFAKGIRDYLRRDFHPNQNDNYHLAEAFLTDLSKAA